MKISYAISRGEGTLVLDENGVELNAVSFYPLTKYFDISPSFLEEMEVGKEYSRSLSNCDVIFKITD